MSGVVLGSNNITINGRIIETRKYTFIEPTSAPSVPKITINSDYKYMTFTNTNINTTTGSLIAHYKFNGNFNDSSGNGHNLLTHAGIPETSTTQFKFGESAFFTNDALRTNGFTFNNRAFSVSVWVYITKNTLSMILSQTQSTSTNNALIIGTQPNNTYRFAFYGNDLDTIAYPGDVNQWVHLVFQIDASRNRQIWRNGVLVAQDVSSSFVNTGSNNVIIGGWDAFYFASYMDDLRIYDRALSPTEISYIYTIYDTKSYIINFSVQTEVQLLLLDDFKYIETTPFLTTGNINLNMGSPSTFNTITTLTNSIPYNNGYISNITGANITYNAPVVIVRYKYTNLSLATQWTYSASNPNVYHLGNVGIGTTNPTSALHVLGSVQVNGAINATSLTANTKNFKIEHPLNINKWLYHGCVESPRFDNIYRGKKIVINGIGEVDIDEECNTTGGMTKGTFESLNTNFSLYVRNNQTYDKVYGIINGPKITIRCNNPEEKIEIDWLVIGERKDENIISNKLTNHEGNLICEHEME